MIHVLADGLQAGAMENDAEMLAPTFDVVTTTAYLSHDAMDLTLDGSKKWPDRKRRRLFAEQHCGLQRKQADMMLGEIKRGESGKPKKNSRTASRTLRTLPWWAGIW